MTATVAGSQAALKVLYPKGEMPKSINEMFNLHKRWKKETDFVGELAYVPLQNSNTQGESAQFTNAQTNIYQGNYVRFALQRVERFSIARVTGQAAEAAVKSEGALVDLWDNETKGAATTLSQSLAIDAYNLGDGVRSGITSGATAGLTVLTLPTTTNMNYFELNMTVGAVDARGFASAVRSGSQRIIAIDRLARTITGTVAWSTAITSLVDADFLVRDGDAHNSGVARCMSGLAAVVVGGTTPGTLHGLNRNPDPVRLAGQSKDYAGWAMEDAIVDASSLAGFQGIGYPNVLVCNNLELATLKKGLTSKLVYNRPGSSDAKYSFSTITIEGENGPIEILADPYCPRNTAYLLKLDQFSLFSLKAAPHLAKYDGMEFIRRPDADAYEVRFAFYGQLKCKNPGPHVLLTNFGL